MSGSQYKDDRKQIPMHNLFVMDGPLSSPHANNSPALLSNLTEESSSSKSRRDFRFWLVFLAIGIATTTSGLELSAITTALPYIVHDLGGSEFVWVGSAYTLAASAFIPLSGGLAQIFGRRPVMLLALFTMSVGAALCGAARSMEFLIAARAVQGLGGGAITSISAIIISDLVPLHERGVFNGLIGIAWSVSAGIGPIVGGALAQSGDRWRWLFYLNIPICGVAGLLIMLFLRVRTPSGTLIEKVFQIDWVGTVLILASTASVVIALTWSGIQYPWTSFHILVPLVLGVCGLIAFAIYDAFVPRSPLVTFSVISTRTSASGHIQNFIQQLVQIGIIYYIPVYLEACKGFSSIRAGVGELPMALLIGPAGIIAGVSVKRTQKYRPQLWLSWIFAMFGTGLLALLDVGSSRGETIAFLLIVALGFGGLVTTTYFPVLAPIPVSLNAQSMAFFMFLRTFSQVWGITIGGAVLQNQLQKRMPALFLQNFPQGTSIAYSAIPIIDTLSEPLKSEIRVAFSQSLKVIWEVYTGIAGIGLIASLFMRGLPLHTSIDKDWGLKPGNNAIENRE